MIMHGAYNIEKHLKPVIVKARDGGQEAAPSTKTPYYSKSCQVWATLEYTLDTVFILTPQSQSARRNLFEGDEPALLAQRGYFHLGHVQRHNPTALSRAHPVRAACVAATQRPHASRVVLFPHRMPA